MKNQTNKFFVSSANWELEVDHTGHEGAAISAVIMAFNKFGKKLLMSTVIMVHRKEDKILNNINKAEFFATHNILKSLGLSSLSRSFKKYIEFQNES